MPDLGTFGPYHPHTVHFVIALAIVGVALRLISLTGPRFRGTGGGDAPPDDTPGRWLRMAYCTSCLDGPEDPTGVVLEWGDREGAARL